MSIKISFTLNGSRVTVDVEPWESLLDVIRKKLGLKGTKLAFCRGACGGCGACTVIVDGSSIYSSILPAYKVNGKKVTTIEGLASQEGLHPLQEAFVEAGAIQCGFCTSGMLMSAKALLDENPDPSDEEIKDALRGNLCRCTGYVKIIEAIKMASKMIRKPIGGG